MAPEPENDAYDPGVEEDSFLDTDTELTEDIMCSQCGDPLVHAEDQEEGMHFLCDPTIEPIEWDEGGEGGC